MKWQAILTACLLASPALAQELTPGGHASGGGRGAPSSEPKAALPLDVTLAEAYKREFAFLAGQKKQLELRLERVGEQAGQDVRRMQAEITGLESQLLAKEASTKALREALVRAEQGTQSTADDQQLIDVTLEQSRTTLVDNQIEAAKAEEGADKAKLLEQRFNSAVALLEGVSSVREKQGVFFRADGTKTEGKIVELGRVAAYGVGAEAAGVLAPAGGGKLKVWREPATPIVRGLVRGEHPAVLPVFLFETLDAAVDDSAGETVLEHVASGGAIAWVIVGLGVLGLIFAAIRALLLVGASSDTDALGAELTKTVTEQGLGRAIEVCAAAKGSASRVVGSVLSALQQGTEDVEDVVNEAMLGEARRLHRFGTIILVIAAVAPLLGLLGTVTGMISTFDIITKFGTGDPKMLSGGISTALVTTELGLIVAIPTLLIGNLLKSWADRIEDEAERAVLRVLNAHRDTAPEAQRPRTDKPPRPAPSNLSPASDMAV